MNVMILKRINCDRKCLKLSQTILRLYIIYNGSKNQLIFCASQLIENLEEMFIRYYMDSNVMSKFKHFPTTHCYVTRYEIIIYEL